MNSYYFERISRELGLTANQVKATARLLAEGATVPFIARYRKEVTGTLDEIQISQIRDRLHQLRELDSRREAIIKSLSERNLLTDQLKESIAEAETMTRLEDIYQPYRPKRRTRAMIAREKGLEPLAVYIWENQSADFRDELPAYVKADKEINTPEEAMAGARDIMAEWISDNAEAREQVRELYAKEAILRSEVVPGKEVEGAKFKDYFDWKEPIAKAPSHRILAIRRGEKEGFLFFSIRPPEDQVIRILENLFLRSSGPCGAEVKRAIADSYKRLLGPSMETEIRLKSKKKADEAAIDIFANNLRELLLGSPLGEKRVLAIDPGFRTGCKTVCLDEMGELLFDTVIYPGQGARRDEEAELTLKHLVLTYRLEAVAIGNGTASRETEAFVRKIHFDHELPIVVVDESGASIYSASEIAREEFPDKDITVRGAVSIGRRLMDPLAELVKLDPKSIGVGQYQHDVDQRLLKSRLDEVVIFCVNKVGVDVNTASARLLSYVSGLNDRLARNLVEYRKSHGAFTSRKEFLKIPGFGPKTYEQCAGFLRVRNGANPLDSSAVHPERYDLVQRFSRDLNMPMDQMIGSTELKRLLRLERYIDGEIGLPTLNDILDELIKPGRDPRKQFELFSFSEEVHQLEDLKVGMTLPGIVTNVAAFGAFVDIGVHQDGLVHISELSDSFVKDPADVVKPRQQVKVRVLEVDTGRKRISLSMKKQRPTSIQDKSRRDSRQNNFRRKRSFARHDPSVRKKSLNDDWFSAALNKK